MPSAKSTGLSGRVLEQKTDRPLSGLVVEAVNEKGTSIKGIKTSVTDATGAFELVINKPDDKDVATALKSGIILQIKTAAGSTVHSTEKMTVKASTKQLGTIQLPERLVSSRTTTDRGTYIRVSVHLPGGEHYEKNVTITLRQRTKSITVKRVKGSLLYEAQVEPGVYQLEVSADPFTSPGRTVTIPREGKTVSIYLGEKDWPFYRLGENPVPFEPREDLFAIVFPSRTPNERMTRLLVQKIIDSLPLKPFELTTGKEQSLPFQAANGAIWLFAITQKPDPKLYARLTAGVQQILGEEVRTGIPVDIKSGQVKVLDNKFVVRFRDNLKPVEIERLAKEVGARILRGFIQAGNARLLEFTRGWYRDYLAVIEQWYKENLLVYGEPDILAEITDDVFPADPPNDPLFGTQANLTLQGADNAWQFLNGINPTFTLGNPTVHVATLDRGVDTDHPDIVGNLTDGTPQLATCYDFSGMRPCTTPGYAPDTSHGMGVYGIISARTDNGTAIAGIAPNVHHIGLERPLVLDSGLYPDVLLWTAGFTTGNSTPGWPAEPIARAADIISCSHGVGGLALSGLMDDTLTYIATYGRGGRGTLMIYSSGNDNMLITGWRTWAAHPRTMAIGNSMQPDGMGVERRDNTSNFGPELDICAQGTNAPSLNPTGGTQIFGGTSAAAPTVNAAAALMLSIEPALTWINLRDILRDTAVVIDPANANPVGQWIGGFSQWYGFGRLDINAAVQGANDFDPGSVNLVVRDNLADDGTFVPSAGTFWRSPDVWVRNSDPVADPAIAYNSNPPNDQATSGADNWVRVRVKNVGSAASSNFWVRAYLTHFAGSEFRYPANYIPSINTGDPLPSPLVQGTYLIGELFVNSLAAGADDTYTFLWPAALVPPEIVNGTHWHPCLLAEVSPHTGPSPSGNLVIDNSNLAQRNITISYSDDDNVHEMTGVIGHADNEARIHRITVYRGNLPKQAKLWVRLPDARVEEATVRLQRTKGHTGKPSRPQDCCCGTPATHAPTGNETGGKIAIDRIRGYRVFRLDSGDRLTLDIPMVSGPLTPVVVGAWMPEGTEAQTYEIPLAQQDSNGYALGGFSLVIKPRG